MNRDKQQNEITIEVVCRNLPGLYFEGAQTAESTQKEQVFLGIQKGEEVIEAVRADQQQVIFRPIFRVGKQPDGSPNFLGPFAKGTPQERFFYLSWGVMNKEKRFRMFRRAKIHLNHLNWEHIDLAIKKGGRLKVVIDMTGQKGDPICGSIRRRRPLIGEANKERERADWQI
ncbi:MAG: DUF5990 family protein [Blastocatellia bacterium]